MADTRFISFEDAMRSLNVEEDELHDLVAANELRAFRVDREMKFKEADVQALAAKGISGASAGAPDEDIVSIDEADVVLVDTPGGTAAYEPVVAEDVGGDMGEPTMPLEEQEEVSLLDEDDGLQVPEVSAEPVDDMGEDGATVVLDEGDLDVEEFGFEDESPTQAAAAEGATEMALEAEDEATEMALEPAGEGGSTEPVLEPASSDGLGTEEIIFEDEDLDIGSLDDDSIGTQEVTVQEAAIGDEMTIQDDTGVGVAASAPPSRSGRGGGRSTVRRSGRASARRTLQVEKRKGDTFTAAVLVLTALMMIYPGLLYVNMAWQGYIAGEESFTDGEIKSDGLAKTYGPLFVHRFFDGFVNYELSGKKPAVWWGKPSINVAVTTEAAPEPAEVPEADGGDAAAPDENAAAQPDPEAAPPAEEQNAGADW